MTIVITNPIALPMANPFFSGRIPPGLSDKIDAHLLTTGETRSELLIRLLRAEVNDNNVDNKTDRILSELIARVEKLEQIANNKSDNTLDRINDNKFDNNMPIVPTETILQGRGYAKEQFSEKSTEFYLFSEFHGLLDRECPRRPNRANIKNAIDIAREKGMGDWQFVTDLKRFQRI
jgi:hypothetical protein